jgi:hypothetical protein
MLRPRPINMLATAATMVVALVLQADAAGAMRSNAPPVPTEPATREATPTDAGSLKPINRPNEKYVSNTCVFDLSEFADFEPVTHLDGCGISVDFDVELLKRTTGQTWGTWGSPPYTESATPLVLHRLVDPATVTITLSKRSRMTGFEAEPQAFAARDISATFLDRDGVVIGTITRSIEGEAGARLLAAQARNVKTITISSESAFAIAQLRVRV